MGFININQIKIHMNAILKKAKNVLKEQATLAVYCKDGQITAKEIAQMAYKGLVGELNLKELIPTMAIKTIPTFDELSDEEIDFIKSGAKVDSDRVENAYQVSVLFFTGVFMNLREMPTEEVKVNIPNIGLGLSLETVNGIGPSLSAALQSVGVKTIEQLAEADPADLANALKLAGVIPAILVKVPMFINDAKTLVENGNK